MTMVAVYIDIETYSEADLKKVGTSVYAAHPSTEVILCTYAVEDAELNTWDIHDGEPLERFLAPLIDDSRYVFHAHNAAFERTLLRSVGIDIPLERWHCDMVHAMSLGFPASLDMLGEALGLAPEHQKVKDGWRLIQKFCVPRSASAHKPWTRCTRETDPDTWQRFVAYNRQDVEAERAAQRRLARWPMSATEWAYWRLDQRVNDTGMPVDMLLVSNALECAALTKRHLSHQMRGITGISNVSHVAKIRDWLADRGYVFDDLTKHSVATALQNPEIKGDVRYVLELRQELGKTSVMKYEALKRASGNDARLRGCYQFYGAARTGRWAGRIFQPQNIPRGGLKAGELRALVDHIRQGSGHVSMDALSNCIRSAIRAPDGRLLRVADLANIESRILGWISGCKRMLRCFETGRDIYKDYATALLGKDYSAVTKEERNYAKPPTLGCGYGLGARGLVAYAGGMFVDMDEAEAQEAVNTFREAYHEIPRLWKQIERVTFELVRERKGYAKVGRLEFEMDGPFLFMVLPSGRRLAYFKPVVQQKEAPWGEMVDNVTYMGVNQLTHKWERISTFGGKWVEQACQAISRDLLAHGMAEADAMGFEIVGHAHDELIALSDADDWLDHDVLAHCMTVMPDWGDKDLHLGAEGFSDVIYRKD